MIMLRKRVYGGRGKTMRKRRKVSSSYFPRVPRGVRPELKTIDDNNGGASPYSLAVTSTGAFFPLNFLATGADINNRVGRKITLKSVQVRLRFTPSGNPAINDVARVMVIYDRQSNQGTPVVSDVLQTIDSAGLTSSTVFDFKSISNEERFLILQDKTFTFPQLAATMAANAYSDFTQDTSITTYNKLNHLCSYGQGSNYPDTGTLWLFLIGSNAPATSPTVAQWTSRVRFTDA